MILPLAFDLVGRPVLVLGAGTIGVRKAATLLEAGAHVSVIATELLAPLPAGLFSVEERAFSPGDLEGFFLVVSAIADDAANDAIAAEAAERRVWLNIVDDRARSSFYFTALHRAGDVVVSVSTSGASPTLAIELRDRLAASLPAGAADAAGRLAHERSALHARGVSTEQLEWRPRVRSLLDHPVHG